MARRVIIDTDPGVDDTFALLLALGSAHAITVEGVTIVPGNGKSPQQLGANARLIARTAGVPDLPIFLASPKTAAGASVANADPCVRINGPDQVHGADSLGNAAAALGQTDADFADFPETDAVEFIFNTCASAPGEITIVCIGPLINLAACLAEHPELPSLVHQVVVMGGAVHGELRGNRTPTAEANFYDDPEAAQAVFTAGFSNLVLADLGVTHQTDLKVLTESCVSQLPAGSKAVQLIDSVSSCYINCYLSIFKMPVAPAHDVVCVMYLLRPDIFEEAAARVEVETKGELTRGMSVVDWRGNWGRPNNCQVLMKVDFEQFVQEFVKAIGNLP